MDRNRVIGGLALLKAPFHIQGIDQAEEILDSAIAMLKAMEPRLMTKEEIMALPKEPMLDAFLETTKFNGEPNPIWAVTVVSVRNEFDGFWIRTRRSAYNIRNYNIRNYGWRLWTARPDDEQRKEVVWDE